MNHGISGTMREDDTQLVWLVHSLDQHVTGGAIVPRDATAQEVEAVLMDMIDGLRGAGLIKEEWECQIQMRTGQ